MPSDNTNPRRRLYAVSFINEFIVFLVVFTIGRDNDKNIGKNIPELA